MKITPILFVEAIIYIDVEDFGVLLEQVEGLDVLLPVRDTF